MRGTISHAVKIDCVLMWSILLNTNILPILRPESSVCPVCDCPLKVFV